MTDKIHCPNCGHHFAVEEALAGKLEAKLQKEYEKKIAEQAARFNSEKTKLEKEREAFENKKQRENELFQQRLDKKLAEEAEKNKSKLQEQFELDMKTLKEENEERKLENRKLKEKEINFLKKEKQLEEKQQQLELDVQKKLIEGQKDIELKAKQQEREQFSLKEREYQKQLEDQKKLVDEMKRKAEQGSMQMQGEVQELALEELLRNTYSFDEISEVGKGIRGADCIQKVINSLQQVCGSIVYESKRTKNFSNDWIDKLKQDQINCKADVAVLVTQTMPTDMERFGEKNGIWICGFHEVKSLSFVLRQMILKTHSVKSAEENKGDKMELMYKYLTGNEFVQNVQRIVENYDNMLNQLNSEKKAMQKIWSMREKQIWLVQENISSLFGSIKGIAGNELDVSDVLSLD